LKGKLLLLWYHLRRYPQVDDISGLSSVGRSGRFYHKRQALRFISILG
jgi:hypothetical protein